MAIYWDARGAVLLPLAHLLLAREVWLCVEPVWGAIAVRVADSRFSIPVRAEVCAEAWSGEEGEACLKLRTLNEEGRVRVQ
jgi:hypothetical protein